MISTSVKSILDYIGRTLGQEQRIVLKASIESILASNQSDDFREALIGMPKDKALLVINEYVSYRRVWDYGLDSVIALCESLVAACEHHGLQAAKWWLAMLESDESALKTWTMIMLERKAYLAGEHPFDEYGQPETTTPDLSTMNLQTLYPDDSASGGEQ